MTIGLNEALQFLNLLLIPAMAYVIKLEKRIFALETILSIKLDALPCARSICKGEGVVCP